MSRVVVVAAAVLAAGAVLLWLLVGGPPDVRLSPGSLGSAPASAGPDLAPASAGAAAAGAGAVSPARQHRGELERSSVELLFVDAADGASLGAVVVHRLPDGKALATAGPDGRCRLGLSEPGQFAAVAPGRMLRMFATRPMPSGVRPQRVELQRDLLSRRVRFEAAPPDSAPVSVLARIVPLTESREPPEIGSAAGGLRRAWSEHRMLAALPALSDGRLHLGRDDEETVFELQPGAAVRFLELGRYRIEAARTDGLVGSEEFEVATLRDRTTTVVLRPGYFVTGVVFDAIRGSPLSAATVRSAAVDPLQLETVTDHDGRFRLGPLVSATVTLRAGHPDFAEAILGPVTIDEVGLRLPLQPRLGDLLRGVVRSRPDLRPIFGASVRAYDGLSGGASVRTDGDGSFALPVAPGRPVRLVINARGRVRYIEQLSVGRLSPGLPPLLCDLWPDNPVERVANGLTGTLAGVVRAANDDPMVDVLVRFQPDAIDQGPLAADRRIVEGGSLRLPLLVRTGGDGRFTIECPHPGSGRLMVLGLAESLSSRVEVQLGERREGLDLQPRR